MLHRFYDTTEGSVRLDGVDIRKISLRQLRRSVAVVLQDVFLFSDTIEENILNLQEAKRNLADQIVTGGGISFGELTKADILKMIEESRP